MIKLLMHHTLQIPKTIQHLTTKRSSFEGKKWLMIPFVADKVHSKKSSSSILLIASRLTQLAWLAGCLPAIWMLQQIINTRKCDIKRFGAYCALLKHYKEFRFALGLVHLRLCLQLFLLLLISPNDFSRSPHIATYNCL